MSTVMAKQFNGVDGVKVIENPFLSPTWQIPSNFLVNYSWVK